MVKKYVKSRSATSLFTPGCSVAWQPILSSPVNSGVVAGRLQLNPYILASPGKFGQITRPTFSKSWGKSWGINPPIGCKKLGVHQTRVTSVTDDGKTVRSVEFETTLLSSRSRSAVRGLRCAGEPSRLPVRPTSAGHDVVKTVVEPVVSRPGDWLSARSSPVRKYVNSSPLPYNRTTIG